MNVTFRCVVLNQPVGQPWLSPDLEFACNDAAGGGFSQFLSTGGGPGWKIRGKRAFHICDPDVGDKCNAIVVRASNDVQYFFAPVIGHNVGNTGSVAGAACKGFCGNPSLPLDIVLVLDRTASLSPAEVENVRDGAQEVLTAYDPSLHNIGLVELPYANPASSLCTTAKHQYYPAVPPRSIKPVTSPPNGSGPIINAWEPPEASFTGGSWRSSPWGLVGLTTDYNGPGSHLWDTIECMQRAPSDLDGNPSGTGGAVYVDAPGLPTSYATSSGGHTNLSDPVQAAANMLAVSDPSIPDVIDLPVRR